MSADNAVDTPGTRQRRITGASTDLFLSGKQDAFSGETLTWCREQFRASHARFIRPMDDAQWVVYTQHRESLITHIADWAEVAMANTVGLGRQPFIARKPRLSFADGGNLRPIALGQYVAIPVLCQDRLVGVVEFAGEVQRDIDRALESALPYLTSVAERMVFDPTLHERRHVSASSQLTLDSGIWTGGDIRISPEELRLLDRVDGTRTLESIAADTQIDMERAIALVTALIERGLVDTLA